MISTAEEFVRLRASQEREEYFKAAHEPAPMSVWLDVIERFPEYREWVAHNKTVPLEILELLAKDTDRGVRSMVAMKNKLTPGLLEQLASDPDEGIRLQIARHKKISREILQKMITQDRSVSVREVARDHLKKMAAPDNGSQSKG